MLGNRSKMRSYNINELNYSLWRGKSGTVNSQYVNDHEFVKEYRKFGYLRDKIAYNIRQINLLNKRRANSINQFLQTNDTEIFSMILIDTEIYFVYAKLLLDSLVPVVKYLENSIPKKMKNSFTNLYNKIKQDGCSDLLLEHIIQNDSDWFRLWINIPRNSMFVHDFTTNGYGGGFHEIDIGITKSSDLGKEQRIHDRVAMIKNNHLQDVPDLQLLDSRKEKNTYQILRQLDRNSEKLSLSEIKKLEEIHKQIGGMFPYIIEVNRKLQRFLWIFEGWTRQKIAQSKFGNDLIIN